MQIWLGIFLFMSLTMNFFQLKAYIDREKEVTEILKMREKLEKIYTSLNKSLSETKKGKK